MTTVNWVLSGSYLVSSENHLLCIMNRGNGFICTGNVPNNWWGNSYNQTVDLNLNGLGSITPIGTQSTPFSGTYNGQNFAIWNYSYTTYLNNPAGLFGWLEGVVSNIVLKGTWYVSGIDNCSFLVGRQNAWSIISNITAVMNNSQLVSTGSCVGTILGYSLSKSLTMQNINVSGTMVSIGSTGNCVGGLVGQWQDVGPAYGLYFNVVFNNSPGIYGSGCIGGIFGDYWPFNGATRMVNNMVGNIEGNDHIGGIFGRFFPRNGASTTSYLHNGMTGNIGRSTSTYVGGCAGSSDNMNGPISYYLSYMKGNILGSANVGAVIGAFETPPSSITNVIIANNGSVAGPLYNNTNGVSNCYYTTSFGLSCTNYTNYATLPTNLSSPFAYHPQLLEIPYLSFTGTEGGNYSLDLYIPNVSGKASYSDYTCFVIAAGNVNAGLFSLIQTSTTYATFYLHKYQSNNATYGRTVYIDPTFPFQSTSLDNVFDYSGTNIYTASIVWVLTGGKYQVSSASHLLCIMRQGVGYRTSGSIPNNYWTASYIQTLNINLSNSSSITPIGTVDSKFTGTYDGSGYSISNWSFTNTTLTGVGLFGCIGTNAVIQNITLTGTWFASGGGSVGFCVGQIADTSMLSNIKANMFNSQIVAAGQGAGGLVGLVTSGLPSLINLSISGTMVSIASSNTCVGGILGGTNTTVQIFSCCINNVVFSANPAISGTNSLGGIVGNLTINSSYVSSNLINNMVGNIVCTGPNVGGIGIISNSTGALLSNYYVSMTGNIQGTSNVTALAACGGGILSNCVVSMRGNIVSTNASITSVIQGVVDSATNICVVMSGSLNNLQSSTGSFSNCYYDTSSGLTVSNTASFTNITGITSLVSPFAYHEQMSSIPYIPISSTDNNGNTFNYYICYPNVSNNNSYNKYERYVLSPGNVDAGLFSLTKTTLTYDTMYLHKYQSNHPSYGRTVYTDSMFPFKSTTINNVFDYTGSQRLYATNYVSYSINWVLSGGNYQISSASHLLCLMNRGSGFTTSGSVPNYWATNVNYLQIVDIDLTGQSAYITPIGTNASPFYGGYNGGNFAILNYKYSTTNSNVGLFGWLEGVVSNIVMKGTWYVSGGSNCSFLVGTANNWGIIATITAIMTNSQLISTGSNVGTIMGYCQSRQFNIWNASVSGTMISIGSTGNGVGGVVGWWLDCNACYGINFNVTFTSSPGIYGSALVGGIFGDFWPFGTATRMVNNMVGNIEGNDHIGGIFGRFFPRSSGSSTSYIHNGMTGNIGRSTSTYVGGCAGSSDNINGPISYYLSYMKGNIQGSSNVGAVIGAFGTPPSSITNVIIANNGTVAGPLYNNTNGVSNCYYTTAFGLSCSNYTNYATLPTNLSSPFTYHPQLPEIPYLSFTGTDGGNYSYDLYMPNISGKASYSAYTCFVIAAGNVKGGFFTLTQSSTAYSTFYLHKYQNNNASFGRTAYIDPTFPFTSTDVEFLFDYSGSQIWPFNLKINVVSSNVSTFGGSNGFINTTVLSSNLPIIYSWNTGDNTANISNLRSGQYTLNVLDSNQKSGKTSLFIGQPLNVTSTVSNIWPYNNNNGTIKLQTLGGMQSNTYRYLWNTGSTLSNLNNLVPGNYNVTITSSNYISVLSNVITQPEMKLNLSTPDYCTSILCTWTQSVSCYFIIQYKLRTDNIYTIMAEQTGNYIRLNRLIPSQLYDIQLYMGNVAGGSKTLVDSQSISTLAPNATITLSSSSYNYLLLNCSPNNYPGTYFTLYYKLATENDYKIYFTNNQNPLMNAYNLISNSTYNFKLCGSFDYNGYYVILTTFTYTVPAFNDQKKFNLNVKTGTSSSVNGNIGIGTSTPQKKLDVFGDINLTGNLLQNYQQKNLWSKNNTFIYTLTPKNIGVNNSSPKYSLDVSGITKAQQYITTSDKRLKTKITDETLGKDFIKSLKPSIYKYIKDLDSKINHGFIAQDLCQINDELVYKDENDYYSLDTLGLIAPIINAIQELNNTVDKQLSILLKN